jgi:hypothetical protein
MARTLVIPLARLAKVEPHGPVLLAAGVWARIPTIGLKPLPMTLTRLAPDMRSLARVLACQVGVASDTGAEQGAEADESLRMHPSAGAP